MASNAGSARAGLPLAKVNPLQARRFAQASCCNAKTDAIDAAMLARMGALLDAAGAADHQPDH